jgi:prepilin peptidase CpaA
LTTVLIAALIAAATDIWKYRVHNALTLPLIATGLIYHTTTGGAIELANSLYGLFFGSSVLMLFYLVGGMGAGDVKLMAGIGAWLGMPATLHVFVIGSVTAGIYAAILMLVSSKIRETWLDIQAAWHRLTRPGKHWCADPELAAVMKGVARRRRIVPFAAMVAVGVLATCVWTWGTGDSSLARRPSPHPGLNENSVPGSSGAHSYFSIQAGERR